MRRVNVPRPRLCPPYPQELSEDGMGVSVVVLQGCGDCCREDWTHCCYCWVGMGAAAAAAARGGRSGGRTTLVGGRGHHLVDTRHAWGHLRAWNSPRLLDMIATNGVGSWRVSCSNCCHPHHQDHPQDSPSPRHPSRLKT